MGLSCSYFVTLCRGAIGKIERAGRGLQNSDGSYQLTSSPPASAAGVPKVQLAHVAIMIHREEEVDLIRVKQNLRLVLSIT